MQVTHRSALTLIELIIVFAIIGILIAMILPAVQSARERARETVCKNNLHQMNLAFEQFAQIHERLPEPNQPGFVGGWAFDLMPFLEQSAYGDSVVTGVPISEVSPADLNRLSIFTCPVRIALTPDNPGGFDISHYVFAPDAGRDTAWFSDSPMTLSAPWVESPETTVGVLRQSKGPHHGGLHVAPIFQGVNLMVDGHIHRD